MKYPVPERNSSIRQEVFLASAMRVALKNPILLMSLIAAACLALDAATPGDGLTFENRKWWIFDTAGEQKTALVQEHSTGGDPDDKEMRTCTVCGGEGVVNVYGTDLTYLRTETCRRCGGTGQVPV